MSYFSDEESGTLQVTRMIIHVVGRKGEIFKPQSELPVQQEGFFRARILDEAADGVHSFNADSAVKEIVERMARGERDFETGSQELARRFCEMHVRQSSGGAFFVFELGCNDPDSHFYALIKYDYREAVELVEADGTSSLRAIVQAFVKERHAVQKFCVVRVRAGVADPMVSAFDRTKKAPDLTDYFESYLGVSRSRSNEELSNALNEALRAALQALRDYLPGRDIGRAVACAKTALEGRDTVTNGDVVEAVFYAAGQPDEEDARSYLEKETRRQLRQRKLEEIEFRPDRRILQIQPRRVVRTVEEVKLEFPAEELGHTVIRQDTPDCVIFTIRSVRLIQDGVLPINSR